MANFLCGNKIKIAKGHTMTYIKLLTVLTTLALLTACGGAAAPADKTGGDTNTGRVTKTPDNDKTGEVNTTDCTATPFNTNCDAVESAITSRQTMCFTSATANPTCGAVIMGACEANPFRAETACMTDTYLPNRIAECITDGNAGEEKCETLLSDTDMNTALTDCLTNPFATACESVTAFTDFALARTNRLTFCNDNMNVANGLCTGANLMNVCVADPFNAICFTDDTYLSPRITDCITGGNAGESKCDTLLSDTAMNTELTDCLTNPFATACESVDGFTSFALARTNRVTFCASNSGELCTALTACQGNPFATECEAYFQTERDNRESFCDMTGNVGNALCMGASLMGVCGVDPFNASCFTEPTYLTERLTDCITGGNAGDNKCDIIVSDSTMNAEITACLTNPFSDACARNADFDDYADMARENRVAFCESGSGELCTPLTTCQGNPFHESCGAYFESAKIPHCTIRGNKDNGECTTTLSRPNAATWAQSFATELGDTPTGGIEFLRGTADGVNLGTNLLENLETLNFNDVFDDDNTTDGLAFFVGKGQAGIFSGTDLGAALPLTARASVKWRGFIQDNNALTTATEFELTVGFIGTGGTLDGLIPSLIGTTLAYDINGTFDAKGVISGNVSRGRYASSVSGCTPLTVGGNPNTSPTCFNSADGENTTLTLSGIIGAEGAVAVFQGQDVGFVPYSGGFVAKPPE